jgi:hypothetical protein
MTAHHATPHQTKLNQLDSSLRAGMGRRPILVSASIKSLAALRRLSAMIRHRTSPSGRRFAFLLLVIPMLARCSRPSWTSSTTHWMSLRGGNDNDNDNNNDNDNDNNNDRQQKKKKYRAIQVQIVHRHGDRTPITTLQNEEFWASTLVSPELLTKISDGTKITRREEAPEHKAGGRGPFGKLTQLGLLQMIEVGTRVREELWSDMDDDFQADSNGHLYHKHIWGPSKPLKSKDIRVMSTDFPRTVQSVQGLLVGFFPEGPGETIEIDCSHTSWMIPDPQPRRSSEQEELEMQLANRPHMLERNSEMLPLAVRCTDAVRHLLGEGAFDMAFGVGEDKHDADEPIEGRVLPWAQLAEITKCLKVRNMLPESITEEDQESLSTYLAWRWFESLRHPRLAYLAMHKFTHTVVHSMKHRETEPALTIYSAHDSTLVGLLCAFRLEQPSVWPEYGSYLKVELLEVTDADQKEGSSSDNQKKYVVRFYLNGDLLRSQWHGELRDEISLEQLSHFISTEGAVNAS